MGEGATPLAGRRDFRAEKESQQVQAASSETGNGDGQHGRRAPRRHPVSVLPTRGGQTWVKGDCGLWALAPDDQPHRNWLRARKRNRREGHGDTSRDQETEVAPLTRGP